MIMSLTGESMMNTGAYILGAGFGCIDVIKTGNHEEVMPGGTATNVLSILSLLGMQTEIIMAMHADPEGQWFDKALRTRGVKRLYYTKTERPMARVIEKIDTKAGRHQFITTCPRCGKSMVDVVLPNYGHVDKLKVEGNDLYNLFFYDRISVGIKRIAENSRKRWNFYEPNSCRMYKNILQGAQTASILKFSQDRIPDTIADKLLYDLQESKVQLLIVSMGEKGLRFALRKKGRGLGEWIYVPARRIDLVVDSSGAGDWLTAVFLYSFLKKYPFYTEELDVGEIKKILGTAQSVAGMKCSYIGAQGILRDNDAMAKLEKYLHIRVPSIVDDKLENVACMRCQQNIVPMRNLNG